MCYFRWVLRDFINRHNEVFTTFKHIDTWNYSSFSLMELSKDPIIQLLQRDSVVCSHYIYKQIWAPVVGKELAMECQAWSTDCDCACTLHVCTRIYIQRLYHAWSQCYMNFIPQLITNAETPLKVVQYHFTSWPDHGVPDYATPMLAFHHRIKSDHMPVKGPLLIHCRYILC